MDDDDVARGEVEMARQTRRGRGREGVVRHGGETMRWDGMEEKRTNGRSAPKEGIEAFPMQGDGAHNFSAFATTRSCVEFHDFNFRHAFALFPRHPSCSSKQRLDFYGHQHVALWHICTLADANASNIPCSFHPLNPSPSPFSPPWTRSHSLPSMYAPHKLIPCELGNKEANNRSRGRRNKQRRARRISLRHGWESNAHKQESTEQGE